MDRMTDEQLDEIDQAMSDGAVTWYQLERLTAETRRLRELERAVRVLWYEGKDGRWRLHLSRFWGEAELEAEATIGQLLEGKEASGE